MLTFDVSVSGAQVGRQLARDPSELAYALVELMDLVPADIAVDLVAEGPYGIEKDLPAWLRKLADQIEAAAA